MNSSLASPRIVSRGGMLIFGVGQECKEAGPGSIPQQWDRLRPYIDHIPGQIGEAAYGVISNFPEGKGFLYIAGVEVNEFPSQSNDDTVDFTRFRVPPQTYAVFHHAGYKGVPGPALERYGREFSAETGLGGFQIWIPVAPI